MAYARPEFGDQRQRFYRQIYSTRGLTIAQLIGVIKNHAIYSPRFRSAALRNLMGQAPLTITQGRPFAQKRILVRKHYNV